MATTDEVHDHVGYRWTRLGKVIARRRRGITAAAKNVACLIPEATAPPRGVLVPSQDPSLRPRYTPATGATVRDDRLQARRSAGRSLHHPIVVVSRLANVASCRLVSWSSVENCSKN